MRTRMSPIRACAASSSAKEGGTWPSDWAPPGIGRLAASANQRTPAGHDAGTHRHTARITKATAGRRQASPARPWSGIELRSAGRAGHRQEVSLSARRCRCPQSPQPFRDCQRSWGANTCASDRSKPGGRSVVARARSEGELRLVRVGQTRRFFLHPTGGQRFTRVVQALDVMRVLDVGLRERAPSGDVVRAVFLLRGHFVELALQPCMNSPTDELHDLLWSPALERLVRGRDRRLYLPGRFQPRVTGPFAGAVQAHEGFEEVHVRQISRLRAELAHGEGFLEMAEDLCLVVLLHPY